MQNEQSHPRVMKIYKNASAQELSITRPQPQDRDSLSCAETAEMQRKTATKQGNPHMK